MWRSVSRDSLIFFGSACSLVVFQFAYRYASVGTLSVSAYGRVALLLSIFNGVTIIGIYGVPATVSRLAARTSGLQRDQELLRSAAIATAVPSAVAVLAMAGATVLVTDSPIDAAVAAVGVPPMIWAVLYSGFIRGKGMVWRAAAIQPVNLVLQTATLLALLGAGVRVGTGGVLASFYAGNFGAYAIARRYKTTALRQAPPVADPPDPEATAGGILRFSAWLALANLAVLMLTIAPRIALAHWSYREVALFDIALLVYTIPQRLRSSFLIALLPVAAVERARGETITVPGRLDLAFVTVGFVALDGLLWITHALPTLFDHVGMHAYVGAEGLLLIIMLAAPAEIFFGLNSGLLQAFGQSRRLCWVCLGVFAVALALMPGATALGPEWLASLLVVAYWALHLLSRRMLAATGVVETSILLPALRSRWGAWRTGRAAESVELG